MTKIIYGDKTPTAPQIDHSTQWWAEDANEVKDTVNENDTTDVSSSATLLFDKTSGRIHGTNLSPISSNLIIDTTSQQEGGMVEIVFNGSENPLISGVASSLIISIGLTITSAGIYSIFIMYTGGIYKVNITEQTEYVGVGNETSPVITVTDLTETSPVITVT